MLHAGHILPVLQLQLSSLNIYLVDDQNFDNLPRDKNRFSLNSENLQFFFYKIRKLVVLFLFTIEIEDA